MIGPSLPATRSLLIHRTGSSQLWATTMRYHSQCDTQHCGAQERRVQPGEPQKGFPGGGRGQKHEIQRVVQTGVENQAPQGELAEARGVEPGGFRNQTPHVFGQSRDFQHIA